MDREDLLSYAVPVKLSEQFFLRTVDVVQLDVKDWRVRLAAVVALGDLDARQFVEQIGALHQDPDHQVRRSAGIPRNCKGILKHLEIIIFIFGIIGIRK